MASSFAPAQQLEVSDAAPQDVATRPKAMSALAEQVLAAYKENDRGRFLDNRFRLQIVAGRYADAIETLSSLRALPPGGISPQPRASLILYEILARAGARQTQDGSTFDEALRRVFPAVLTPLDDATSALAIRVLTLVNQSALSRELDAQLARQKGKDAISLEDARSLLRAYQVEETFRSLAPLAAELVAEDDRRRYLVEKDIPVRTADGATVCAIVVRPRTASVRLPALLEFTIYADPGENLNESRMAAAHGYAGVVGLTRGKGCSPDKPVPYLHDGSDAATLIDWISAQSWSDGRVGMYGGSYSGFTPWATAKRMPKGLKTIMVGAPAAPGIDVPMEGNVFWNFVYPWPFYTTYNKTLDNATYYDSPRWDRLNHDWYLSGRPYRELDKIDRTPNPIFDDWVAHPTYDAWWQSMIPFKRDFARINIPVLTTAGYFFGGPGAAVYYLTQHTKYNPKAEHYLLIGPYDHFIGQRGTIGLLGGATTVLAGYELDPVAQIDMGELRYQWFDFVFRNGPRPTILQDRVNYQVMGANAWKHAPSVAAMADHTLRFHLSAARSGEAYRLSSRIPAHDAFIAQTVNFADRSDVDRKSVGGGILDKAVDTWNGLEFVSDPLPKPMELSGVFSGRLDFITNKKDFDFEIDLYELTPRGEYVQLAPYWSRASHVGDLSDRRLLTPGKRQRLHFRSVRLMSRQLQRGSRVVAVLSVIKDPGREINYGTGKDVSEESIADSKEPLQIKWFGASYLDLPVGSHR
ncbi:MAG TPA: CocE/NonD family hydrolase [Thermoanaerobaculia bacterium]|nr:CocE/NonD family hydrolase [Thermoanaerobaculia bacterium]